MKCNFKKVLFGLSVSLVLAMAIGSFALSEAQTPATPQVAASNDDTGNFAVSGEGGTVSFVDPLLTIDGGSYTISMEEGVTSTSQRIEVTGGATVTLDGVTVDDTTDGPAITISGSQDVTILLADGSKNVLKGKAGSGSSNHGAPGIQKTDSASGWLIIGVPEDSEGTGELEATGGYYAAGIGGGSTGNGSNITISGGTVTATGGYNGAGIGGGSSGEGSKINIEGGTVTATGGDSGAGIGGGPGKSGSAITISGGVVKAIGGALKMTIGIMAPGAGIGGGYGGSGSDNKLNGNAIVFAASGNGRMEKDALEGFGNEDESFLTQGVAFTGTVTDYSDPIAIDWKDGEVYGNTTIDSKLITNLELLSILTINEKQSLTINQGVTLTVPAGKDLQNEGTLTINGNVDLSQGGKITTLVNYDTQGGTVSNYSEYKTYKDSSSSDAKAYGTLPSATKSGYDLGGWYTESGIKGTKITDTSTVLLNQHTLSARWIGPAHNVTVDTCDHGTITVSSNKPKEGQEVTFKLIPNEECKVDEDPVVKTNGGSSVEFISTGNTNEYKFLMPSDDVTVSAIFKQTTYNVTVDKLDNGSITSDVSEAAKGDEVTFTVSPAEGYQLQENSLKVMAGTTAVAFTDKGEGKYSFTMPGAAVQVSAVFEQIPDPTPPGPEPGPAPEPTPGPSVDPDGDGSGSSSKTSDPFMGGVALALLGVATTGAILVRKRK